MPKHRFAALFFVLFLGCSAVIAGDAVQEAMEAFANEPPLTQADVDAFIKMIPEVNKGIEDPEAVMKLYQDSGMSPQRFSIISYKIAIAFMMTQGVSREQVEASGQVPDFMIPTDAEIELVGKNAAALEKLME